MLVVVARTPNPEKENLELLLLPPLPRELLLVALLFVLLPSLSLIVIQSEGGMLDRFPGMILVVVGEPGSRAAELFSEVTIDVVVLVLVVFFFLLLLL